MFQISALDHQMHSHYTAWFRVGHKACVSEQCLERGFGELGLSEETGDTVILSQQLENVDISFAWD